MKIFPGFDSERQLVIITVKTNLLIKYFPNFYNLIKQSPNIPEGVTVERGKVDSASILFPLPYSSEVKRLEEKGMAAISIEGSKMKSLYEAIGKFINSAMRKELKNTEFLPLENYSLDNLKEDMLNAIKEKRNFCIIKDYKEYENMKKGIYSFDQLYLDYLSQDYCNVAIDIYNGNIKNLKKALIPRMKNVEWY